MRTRAVRYALARSALPAAVALLAGCSLVADFGKYHTGEGSDGGGFDAGSADAGRQPDGGDVEPDAGFTDAGDVERDAGGDTLDSGGPVEDGGAEDGGAAGDAAMADAGVDAGPMCDPPCPPGETCDSAGDCLCGSGPSGASGQTCCDGECVSLGTADHCASCGDACAGGADCCSGVCEALDTVEDCGGCGITCSSGQGCCDGVCTDLDTTTHCGSCGNACGAADNTNVSCDTASGTCMYTCTPGFGACDDGNVSDGCETPLNTSTDCGACGSACTGSQVCGTQPGGTASCTLTCPPGQDLCGGTCYDAGAPCTCVDGAAPGAQTCVSGSVRCDYPAEVCNGLDDDCDGTPDNGSGMQCSPGQVQNCSVPVGTCTARGTRSCNTLTCSYNECVIREVCDRTDADCDGFVDEGMLIPEEARGLVSAETTHVRSDYGHRTGEIGVVYGEPDGTGRFHVHFLRVDRYGRPLMDPELVAEGVYDFDIAYDNPHWTVVLAQDDGSGTGYLSFARFDWESGQPTTGVKSTRIQDIRGVRMDRIGFGGDSEVAVVAQADYGGEFRAEVHLFRVPEDPRIEPDRSASAEFEFVERIFGLAATTTTNGAALFWSVPSGTDAVLHFVNVQPGFIPGTVRRYGEGNNITEVEPEASFDPVHGIVGLAFADASSRELVLATLRGGDPMSERGLGAAERWDISYAGEQAFGVLFENSNGSFFGRFRSTDLAEVPERLRLEVGEHVEGVPAGEGRYVAFGHRPDLVSQPVLCGR